MNSTKAVRAVTILCVASALSPAAINRARAQQIMDSDGTWTYRYDFKLDGKVEGEVREWELVLAVRNGKIAGRSAAAQAGSKEDDRWSGEVAGKDKGIVSLRQDRKDGYVAFFVGRLTEPSRIHGTWYDTGGNSGDFTFAKATTAPPKVDLRPEFEKLKLDVRQQGMRGACQTFAMVGVIEYDLARRGKQVDLSEQFIMWAANEANRLNRTGGFHPDRLIAGLKQYGICEESLMPYIPREEPIEKPSAEAIKDAKQRTSCEVISIKHWSSDIGFGDKEIKEIIRKLETRTPVAATFCWPIGLSAERIVDAQHFMIDKDIDGKSKDGHGVILVGYGLDDKIAGGGYFIFRNSWGPEFADKGYARITFEYARKYGTDTYIVSVR